MISANELENRVERIPFSGCWLWMGSRGDHGYGDLRKDGRHLLAHRVAFEIYKGPIPSGHHVLHTCDVRCCVNPTHLFSGTNADNIADRVAKGRSKGPSYRPSGLKYVRRSANAYESARKVDAQGRAEARAKYAAGGFSIRKLASEYGVSFRAMWGYLHS